MHSLYADIFQLTPLKLKPAFGGKTTSSTTQQSLILSEQLASDIKQAHGALDLSDVKMGPEISITHNRLTLPSAQLSPQQKRQLWNLFCEVNY